MPFSLRKVLEGLTGVILPREVRLQRQEWEQDHRRPMAGEVPLAPRLSFL